MSKKVYGGISIQNAQEIGFFDADSSNFIALKAPASLTGNATLTLPDGDSTGTQALVSNGSGVMSWSSFLGTTLASGDILLGNGSNVATAVTISGDIAIDNAGVTAIASGVIVDADVNASAAIALTKLAATTVSRALVSDGSGVISASAVTATELGYVSGVTSGIQAQLNTLSSTISNFEWQASAIDYVVDNTAVPATEVSGDRYILSHDGGTPHANYDGAAAGDIVEFNGTSWVATTPTAGTFIAADDEASVLYLFGGSTWSTKSFEATTASTGLTKVGFDIRLDATAAGTGLGFTAGVLNVNVDDSTIEVSTDTLQLKDGGITNAKINASAGIALSKLAATTANRALATDGSGFLVASAVTDTELGYLDGVTSAIQTQFTGKAGTALDNLTIGSLAAEDLLVASSGTAVGRLAVGSNGQILTVSGGAVTWATPATTGTFASDWVTGDGTSLAVSHNLGSKDVMVQIYDKTDDSTIEIDSIVRTDTNTVTVAASSAPPAAGWRVVIFKV
jgi:hypothetical protein